MIAYLIAVAVSALGGIIIPPFIIGAYVARQKEQS